MVERGRVRIGDSHEVITAVRFGSEFSYAMTFDQRDPFYILDIPEGEPPTIRSMLKLDGFAQYLHPLYDDDSNAALLVGIGQNTTGSRLDQVNSGVLISVLDVSDPDQPRIVTSQMLEDDDNVESYTQAQWDPHRVQYANGKLIIPLQIHYYYHNDGAAGDDDEENTLQPIEPQDKSFSGFIVIDVSLYGINEVNRVSKLHRAPECHYCDAAFTETRTLLLKDGSLVTMWDNYVVSTNVTSGVELGRSM
jgi:hypothetical protein